LMLVGIADHGGDAREGGDLFGGALGVASGDDNFGQRVLALHATNGGPRVLIGGGGNRTRIQDDEIGACRGRAVEPASLELTFESSAIGLRGPASEVFYVIGCHRIMVTQASDSCALRCLRAHSTSSAGVSRQGGEARSRHAVAAVLLCVKHSRQKIGRP